MTVLLVDDDADFRMAMAFSLKFEVGRILEAGNGRMALEMIRSQPVDLVITDIRMPGGDGIELLEEIQKLPDRRPGIFVITGFSDSPPADLVEKGALRFFVKPFRLAALLEAVLVFSRKGKENG